MTVNELRKELAGYNPEATVHLEYCPHLEVHSIKGQVTGNSITLSHDLNVEG